MLKGLGASDPAVRDLDPPGPSVVVVGAGPVGLSVALGLARKGRRVLVLEREASTAERSRAPAIWPRTQEILSRLGVLDAFLSTGITLPVVRLWDADEDRLLIELPIRELGGETAFPRLLIVPQSRTERLLLEAVEAEPAAEVLFSAPVTDVEQDPGGVRVTFRRGRDRERARAAFVVGCDGARSTVRKSLGASFEGVTYAALAALADVRLAHDRDLPFPRLTSRGGLAVGIRIETDLWRLIIPFAGAAGQTAEAEEATKGGPTFLEQRVEAAARSLFPGVASSRDFERVWQSEFRLHRRVSSRFVSGRVALAGDAAHLNSPVGGQGMNAGIQDAAELIPALLEALDGKGHAPLERYAASRRAAVEEGVNVFTDRLTRVLLFREGALVKPLVRAAGLMLRIGPIRRRFLRRVAMLDTPSRGGPDP